MTQDVSKRENNVEVTLALPFVMRLQDGYYKGKMDGNEFVVILQNVSSNLGEDEGQESSVVFDDTGKLIQATNVTFPGGMLQYSLVRLCFRSGASIVSNEIQERQVSMTRAHRYLNHFIDVYRFVTSDIEARPLTSQEFREIRANQALRCLICQAEGNQFTTHCDFGEHGITMPPSPFGHQIHQQITEFLLAGERPPLVELLLLNAKSFFEEGALRLSVIELGSALDIDVEQIARKALKVRGELTQEKERRLEGLSTKGIVERELKRTVKQPIVRTKEWKKIDKEFWGLRNKVIHDAYVPTAAESTEAMRVVESFHQLLKKLEVQAKPENRNRKTICTK